MAALGLRQLDLNAVDAIHTVDEQNQYENEGDLLLCKPFPAKTGISAEIPSCHIVALL